jgi:hypothetical protein
LRVVSGLPLVVLGDRDEDVLAGARDPGLNNARESPSVAPFQPLPSTPVFRHS